MELVWVAMDFAFFSLYFRKWKIVSNLNYHRFQFFVDQDELDTFFAASEAIGVINRFFGVYTFLLTVRIIFMLMAILSDFAIVLQSLITRIKVLLILFIVSRF